MKKILIVLGLSLGVTNLSQAQSFSINPEVGLNLSSLHHSDDIETIKDNTIGFRAGLSVNIAISKNLSLEPGLFFKMNNAHFNETSNGTEFNRDFSLSYLEVPLNLYYQIPIVFGKIFLSGGPYVGLGLSGEQTLSINGIKTEFDKSVFGSDEDQLSNLDYGFNFGAGYKTPIGLYARVQYGLGMGNISNVSDQEIQHRSWLISLGWALEF
ncbi:MAG TPA: porin family protein [Chitinophagaceae bacterium]|nr:porin family protein [Chitinophagaceae bacterium]